MKRVMLTLVAAMSLGFGLTAPVLAEDAKPAKAEKPARAAKAEMKPREKKEGTPGVRGYYAIMASVTEMTPEQKAQLMTKVDARNAELKAWDEKNKPKLKELDTAIDAAQTAKDKEKAKTLSAERKTLLAGRGAIETKHTGEIEGLLTPPQKATWEAHQVYTATMSHYGKRVAFTEEQKTKVRAITKEATSTIPAQGKERKAAMEALYKKVDNEVLTAEQREALKAPPAPREKKDEKDAKATPAKAAQ